MRNEKLKLGYLHFIFLNLTAHLYNSLRFWAKDFLPLESIFSPAT